MSKRTLGLVLSLVVLFGAGCDGGSPDKSGRQSSFEPAEPGSEVCGSDSLDDLGTDPSVLERASAGVELSSSEIKHVALFWAFMSMADEGTLSANDARVLHEELLPAIQAIAFRYDDLFRPCDEEERASKSSSAARAAGAPPPAETVDCGCDSQGRPGAGCSQVLAEKTLTSTFLHVVDQVKDATAVAKAITAVKRLSAGGKAGMDLADYAATLDDDTALEIAVTVGNVMGTVGAVAVGAGATSPLLVAAAAVGTGVAFFESGLAIYKASVDAEVCSATAEGWDCDEDGVTWSAGDCQDCDAATAPVATNASDYDERMAEECAAWTDTSCDGLVGPDGTEAGCSPDEDGDGWSAYEGDCNDSRPDINPGVSAELDECLSGENLDCDDTIGLPDGVVYTYYYEATDAVAAECGYAFQTSSATWTSTGPVDCPADVDCDFALTGEWQADYWETVCLDLDEDGETHSFSAWDGWDGVTAEAVWYQLNATDSCLGYAGSYEEAASGGSMFTKHYRADISW